MSPEQETKLLADVEQAKIDAAVTRQAVMGNGVKGLAERVGELEGWRHTHPRLCPFEKKKNEIFAARTAEAAVIGVVVSVIVLVLKLVKVI